MLTNFLSHISTLSCCLHLPSMESTDSKREHVMILLRETPNLYLYFLYLEHWNEQPKKYIWFRLQYPQIIRRTFMRVANTKSDEDGEFRIQDGQFSFSIKERSAVATSRIVLDSTTSFFGFLGTHPRELTQIGNDGVGLKISDCWLIKDANFWMRIKLENVPASRVKSYL